MSALRHRNFVGSPLFRKRCMLAASVVHPSRASNRGSASRDYGLNLGRIRSSFSNPRAHGLQAGIETEARSSIKSIIGRDASARKKCDISLATPRSFERAVHKFLCRVARCAFTSSSRTRYRCPR
ncbi:hypothetical protein BCV70DRAFT_202782 [Testicularia cyperi]|uniref:Uncharacterized protein n=1 Tax=Testicularia cyperi TaxID=1882483 RepID=A0A317XJQ7_9BASI|nr:hypothetical protein BCV70DRAFT_202782 [Testicularia cyperi]